MAVLKIFPEKDATLYSLFPNMNTGLDEIVEATLTTFAYSNPNPQTSRFLATTSSVVCLTVAQPWDMGTGRYLDEPISTDGCSWIWAGYSGSTIWSPPNGATISYTSSVPAGGGVWWTGSAYSSSVTFSYRTNKDINLDVTNIVKAWTTSSATYQLPNNGFLLKQNLEFVYNKNYQPELKYFSVDTNTIYPPALQISWDDSVWNTGSSTQTVLNSLPAVITL